MEKLLDKFSLYEFVVYFIPGTSLLGILILQNFSSFDIINYKEYSLFFTFVLFFIGYFLGIIVHEVGELLQHIVFKGNTLMMKTECRTITKHGITFLNMHYRSEAILGLREQVFIRYSLFDLSKIFVYSSKGEFLCVAKRVQKVHPI